MSAPPSSGGKRHKKRQKGRGVAASLEEANPVQSPTTPSAAAADVDRAATGTPPKHKSKGKGKGKGKKGKKGAAAAAAATNTIQDSSTDGGKKKKAKKNKKKRSASARSGNGSDGGAPAATPSASFLFGVTSFGSAFTGKDSTTRPSKRRKHDESDKAKGKDKKKKKKHKDRVTDMDVGAGSGAESSAKGGKGKKKGGKSKLFGGAGGGSDGSGSGFGTGNAMDRIRKRGKVKTDRQACTVLIKKLSNRTTDEDVLAALGRKRGLEDSVAALKISYKKDDGSCLGYGYVEMISKDLVPRAIKALDGAVVAGVEIVAIPRIGFTPAEGQSKHDRNQRVKERKQAATASPAAKAGGLTFADSDDDDDDDDEQEMAPGSTPTIFVGNIPYSIKESVLERTFGKIGYIVQTRLITDGGKSRGCAHIQFSSNEEATAALALDGTAMGKRKMRVSLAPEKGWKRKSQRWRSLGY